MLQVKKTRAECWPEIVRQIKANSAAGSLRGMTTGRHELCWLTTSRPARIHTLTMRFEVSGLRRQQYVDVTHRNTTIAQGN